jgi:hypothetical protein
VSLPARSARSGARAWREEVETGSSPKAMQ